MRQILRGHERSRATGPRWRRSTVSRSTTCASWSGPRRRTSRCRSGTGSQRLIDGLAPGDPARVEGERAIARLQRLADEGQGSGHVAGPRAAAAEPAARAARGLTSSTGRGAVERLLPLLAPEHRDGADISRGYVDVLQRDLEQPGLVGDLMQAGPVSRIYERWWRPGLGRVAKGLTGPGMAEEKRIARLLMGLGPGDGVLDVACGPGNFTRDFARAVGDEGLAVGVDGSRPMLERAVRETAGRGHRQSRLRTRGRDIASVPSMPRSTRSAASRP